MPDLIMKKGTLIVCGICNSIIAFSNTVAGFGRGVDVEEENEILVSFDTALMEFFIGIIMIAVGAFLLFLYNNKWDDKEYIETTSHVFTVIGVLLSLSFIQYIWSYIVYTILALLLLGYIVYFILISKSCEDKEMKEMRSLSKYIDLVLVAIGLLVDKINEKFW